MAHACSLLSRRQSASVKFIGLYFILSLFLRELKFHFRCRLFYLAAILFGIYWRERQAPRYQSCQPCFIFIIKCRSIVTLIAAAYRLFRPRSPLLGHFLSCGWCDADAAYFALLVNWCFIFYWHADSIDTSPAFIYCHSLSIRFLYISLLIIYGCWLMAAASMPVVLILRSTGCFATRHFSRAARSS